MSRTPIVTGWRGAAFGGVDFAKYVTSWEDTRDRSGTVHAYIKRDGGEGEDTGRKSHLATVHLAFIGPTWLADFKKLQAAIDSNPIQTLTHPVYGAMTAYCRSSAARMDIENAPNLYEVVLRFEESQVDTNVSADASASTQGPAAKQNAVASAVSQVAANAVLFATAASAITALTAAATTYTAAAVASAAVQTPDPTLAVQLAGVLTLTNAAITAIQADPLAAPGVSDPAVMSCELLYDTCTQVDDSVRALRPQLGTFVVPMDMHITALAAFLYGTTDGPTREAEILTNNADKIPDPGFILAGTQLQVAPATVVR